MFALSLPINVNNPLWHRVSASFFIIPRDKMRRARGQPQKIPAVIQSEVELTPSSISLLLHPGSPPPPNTPKQLRGAPSVGTLFSPRTQHASPRESPLILRTKPTSDYLLQLVLRNLVQGLKGGSSPEASRPAIRPRICPSSIWDGKTLDDLAPSDPGAKPSSTVLFPRPPPYLCPKDLARVPGRLPSSTP